MKIAKGIASVLKTIGLVVMAIAIVMSIYVVANDGAGWSTLRGRCALISRTLPWLRALGSTSSISPP